MNRSGVPALIGVVLAGGESRRMGRDKGSIELEGRPLAERAHSLLEPVCERVYVSVREAQSDTEPYCRLPLLLDDGPVAGPAAGLLAAWSRHPGHALFVLAVDLPAVNASVIDFLIAHRDAGKLATACRHPDGVIEPLVTIWEPTAATGLQRAAERGTPSLRRLLESADVALLDPPEPVRLVSVNTPGALRGLREEPDAI